ncbi:hypothetical protein O6H91_05G020400 [Diphasiastrum complanatum]|uniref:Uncharacterized protein n=1 Tax=Diphasiastrum complanatum TaxID=34168 RepID=A0ACC2DL62_DIPCM|nr:hypothetical protein O6H91_05G020400 [Diphasiastrum complanatum]
MLHMNKQFVREIFHGQLTVKLKKGTNFPAMDLWGLSDPYVVLRIGDSVVRSRTIWASLEPVWNETFSINVVDPNEQLLQVAAWDANIVSAHRRMGNVGISLGPLLDGKWHELELELEGMGGGGKVFLEVRYRTFAEIDAEKRAWAVPFLSQILQGNGLDFALKYFFGAEGIRASDFVRSALGYFDQINQFNGADIKRSTTLLGVQKEDHVSSNLALPEANSHENNSQGHNTSDQLPAAVTSKKSMSEENKSLAMSETTLQGDKNAFKSSSKIPRSTAEDSKKQSVADNDYFNMLASTINRTLEAFNLNEIDFHIFGGHKQSDHDILTKLGSEAQIKAEASFMDTGLALPSVVFENENHVSIAHDTISSSAPSTDEVKQASQNILSTMEEVLGSWLMLGTSKSGHTKNYPVTGKSTESNMISTTQKTEEKAVETLEETTDEKERDEMRKMFKRAESAMEAWAMLAMSLGCTSFVKSEFEKICFIENERTDTQVAIWRDFRRHRLVVAFRGTEQTQWKDLKTDLMLVPTGFDPERVAGVSFNTEAMVHSGFLSAYDSVKSKILSIIRTSARDTDLTDLPTWKIYITGHSLGGALATLLALELSRSKLAKQKHISITMYNFGSPRVGNKIFAESYNKVVKDSWRVVNHRDIIPTVPRMMGYCHVAQPIYFSRGRLLKGNCSLFEDGYNGDIIGEATPDLLLHEFMKGEKQLLDRLIQTEVTMLRAIRDGSALMQHMEDFYYVSLLEQVSSKSKSTK